VSAPVTPDVPFSAWLESPDVSESIPFARPLFFTPGLHSSAEYSGEVSTLSGNLHLTAAESAAVFGTDSATLLLINGGDDITLGLTPNTLHNQLQVSLSGGPLSVGAFSAR
jgi:hypothetical protein